MTEYLNWQSKLTLEHVFAKGESFSFPSLLNTGFIYLSHIKEENNRCVLKYKKSCAEEGICITPAPFNLRTKINEYGGKPFWVLGDQIYFSNHLDQRIYRQNIDLEQGLTNDPVVVTPESKSNQSRMYADLVDCAPDWMLAIVETSFDDHSKENCHSIQAFSKESNRFKISELVTGASFYSNLVISNDRSKVAWVQWDHPDMPWDETQLWVADISIDDNRPSFVNQERVELVQRDAFEKLTSSVCQLIFANNGTLFFSVDFQGSDPSNTNNFWNVWCYQFGDKPAAQVSSLPLEFGYPHWQYGDARIVQLDEQHLLTFATNADGDELFLINQETLKVSAISTANYKQKSFQNLSSNGRGKAVSVMLSVDTNPCVIALNVEHHQLDVPSILLSNPNLISTEEISVAEHFAFETRDKTVSYGYYYPPVNCDYQNETAPPVIVMVHGGPTARTYGYFDIQKQFWTNRGFAIFDVNPRGSTGYGRAYRDALYAQWGVSDISDIVDGIQYLVSIGKVDPVKVCIRGKSSGGYAVLCALTDYPDIFQAGACYYGIGNLATLQEVTHKFEKFYTENLVNERYESELSKLPSSRFYQRSPIHKISNLQTSMIIFQGLEDKIVPPSVALEIVDALQKNDVAYSYVEYPEEGHGFRQIKNNIDALTQELSFYRSVLSNK